MSSDAEHVSGAPKNFLSKITTGVRSIGAGIANVVVDGVVENIKGRPNPQAQTQSEPIVSSKQQQADKESTEERVQALAQHLYVGYFTAEFDPVEYQLLQLSNEASPDEIDCLVDKFSTFVEIVSNCLSRHVVKHHDILIDGINTVASVEDDLKAALLETTSGRASLKRACNDVQRLMKVTAQTRRKQGYMELLEVCVKVQRAKDLQQSVRKAQESGDYGEAIMLCIECFKGVSTLSDLTVSEELRGTVQRLYVETLTKLDTALTNNCGEFNPVEYSRILEGYLVQGVSGNDLAGKVLSCFKDSIHDVCVRVVRSLLLTKPRLLETLMNSSLETSYGELCRNLPVDLLRPCLLQLLDVLFDVLASYHIMTRWHLLAVQSKGSHEPDSPTELLVEDEMTQVERITRNFLLSVHDMLLNSREEVWEAAARHIKELFDISGLFKGEDFLQLVEWCEKFLAVGEAFMGKLSDLRGMLVAMLGKFFEVYHQGNIESLHTTLSMEAWKDISTIRHSRFDLSSAIVMSHLYVPSFGEPDAIEDFTDWIAKGNPFKKDGIPDQKKKKRHEAQLKMFRSASEAVGVGTHTKTASFEDYEIDSLEGSDEEIDSPLSVQQAILRHGESIAPQGESSGRAGHSTSEPALQKGADQPCRMMTISSTQILRWIKQYASLIRPLQPKAEHIHYGICSLFDTYLLSTFMLFGNISLEELVWQEDCCTLRLRTTMLRILTGDESPYRQQVEELQRQKPQPKPIAKPAGEFIEFEIPFSDVFANKIKNKLSAFNGSFISTAATSADNASTGYDLDNSKDIVSSGNLFGLKERVVAVESLLSIADELKAGRNALMQFLPPRIHRDVDNYFTRTVDATQDFKACIYRGGARALLQALFDPEKGLPTSIGSTSYAVREPSIHENGWVHELNKTYAAFKDTMNTTALPGDIVVEMWEHAIAIGSEAMLEGLARVKRCTLEGRACMSFDLSMVEKNLRFLCPSQVSVFLRTVDAYVKAFYIPWDELAHWSQTHLPEYGKYKILALIECIAEAYKIKRQQKKELLAAIDADLAEYA